MASLPKGEQVVCPRGTVCGSVAEDIPDDAVITERELRIKADLTTVAPGLTGHICKCCGERVTDYRNARYRIRLARGWVGHIPP